MLTSLSWSQNQLYILLICLIKHCPLGLECQIRSASLFQISNKLCHFAKVGLSFYNYSAHVKSPFFCYILGRCVRYGEYGHFCHMPVTDSESVFYDWKRLTHDWRKMFWITDFVNSHVTRVHWIMKMWRKPSTGLKSYLKEFLKPTWNVPTSDPEKSQTSQCT